MIKTGYSLFPIMAVVLLSASHAAQNENAARSRNIAPLEYSCTQLCQPESVLSAGLSGVVIVPRVLSTKSPIEMEPRIAAAKQVDKQPSKQPASGDAILSVPSAVRSSNSQNRLGQLLGQLQPDTPNPEADESAAGDSKSVLFRSLGKDSSSTHEILDDSVGHNESVETPSDGSISASDGPRSELPRSEPFVPTSATMSLQRPLQQCLAIYDHQYLNTEEHACWSTMHLLLAHGENSRVHVGGHGARTASAVDWLCKNNPCAGRRILYLQGDILRGRVGPGFQGHESQLLAIMAQIQVPATKPLFVDGREFTLSDLVRSEQVTCREGTELTFKLIGLLHYLPSDASWTSEDGTKWDFPKLIHAELGDKINGAACGGVHRVMAISQAALKRKYRDEPMDGEWWRAEKYMLDYQRYAFSLQNPDGSFSSDWFKTRANWGDRDRQLQTTGHILEWLVYSLPDKDLSDPRLVRAVSFLTNLMVAERFHDWEKGPKGHAIRALNLYYERVYGHRDIANEPLVFDRPNSSPDTKSVFSRFRNRFK